jgi:hypothetical protein
MVFPVCHAPLSSEVFMPRLICYCFGHTEEDLRRDVVEHGRSLILERIVSAKKSGQCRCAEKNPASR